jgi:hypothetical protein
MWPIRLPLHKLHAALRIENGAFLHQCAEAASAQCA